MRDYLAGLGIAADRVQTGPVDRPVLRVDRHPVEAAPGQPAQEVGVTRERPHPAGTLDSLFPEPIRVWRVPGALPRSWVVGCARLADRDAAYQDDFVGVVLDTFNDERRAFQFRVNPLGVQADANFSELEGYEDFSWDAIWASAGKITDFGYTVEVAIPFNQLRFPKGGAELTMGFEADRSWPRNVRHRMSTHVRDRDRNCILCQFNKLSGFQSISPGKNLEFDPTLTVQRSDAMDMAAFPEGELESGKVKVEPGISARWGVTPNLMLNATVNPDFSQVEADAAQLDINTRFALRYPEKRPFFLEGGDFFLTPLEMVFTRSVADPLWGGKVTGKIGANAVGVFSAWEKSKQYPEIHDFIKYLVYWVAGTKLIFILLLGIIVLFGDMNIQRLSLIALALATLTFFWRLFPLVRKMDRNGQIAPRNYSIILGGMILLFITVFMLAALTS